MFLKSQLIISEGVEAVIIVAAVPVTRIFLKCLKPALNVIARAPHEINGLLVPVGLSPRTVLYPSSTIGKRSVPVTATPSASPNVNVPFFAKI